VVYDTSISDHACTCVAGLLGMYSASEPSSAVLNLSGEGEWETRTNYTKYWRVKCLYLTAQKACVVANSSVLLCASKSR
jgi:hypothetical protein